MLASADAKNPTLLGIEVGGKFEVPDCAAGGPGGQTPEVCSQIRVIQPWRDGPLAEFYNIYPAVERRPTWITTFEAIVRNGVVIELRVHTKGLSVQDEAFDAIRTRLGQPRSRMEKQWQHRTLGRVVSISAQWRTRGWQADFESILGDLDAGLLTLSLSPEPKKPSPPL